MDRAQWLTIERLTWALEAALAEASERDRAVGERLARLECEAEERTLDVAALRADLELKHERMDDHGRRIAQIEHALTTSGGIVDRIAALEERAGVLCESRDTLSGLPCARPSGHDGLHLRVDAAPAPAPTPTPRACDERCVGTCEPDGVPHSRLTCENWHKFRCDGTGPAHRPAAAATAEPERTDTPSVPPSGSVAPAVPTTGRLVAVGTCYSHPTWGDHEHEAGCINWCWSVRYGMSAAPPAPVFALTEWEREHVRIGLAAGKGSLVGTLARLAVRALAALGVPLDGEGSR